MALLFEKPSLRTRVSFETGMIHLGGGSLFLGDDAGFGARESIADFARALSQYVDTIVVRTKRHATVVELASYCTCSVINGLTDHSHPCQALADLYTLRRACRPVGRPTLAFIGDANNVARSLLEGCALLGMRLVMATPTEYRFSDEMSRRIDGGVAGSGIRRDRRSGRGRSRRDGRVHRRLDQHGPRSGKPAPPQAFCRLPGECRVDGPCPGAFFMHCLPAHRGEEVTDEVIDGPQSVVVQQAGNRLHVQKGVLAWLLSRSGKGLDTSV